MYKFRIKDNYIFRDKLNSDNIIIDSEPILDKDTLLQALAQWTYKGVVLDTAIEHCRINPTDNCPKCPRYKDDCEGLEQHEDMFGIQDELDKLTIRPDKQEELTELQLGMRNGKYERACGHCKHKVMNDSGYESCEKWDCTFEPKETNSVDCMGR